MNRLNEKVSMTRYPDLIIGRIRELSALLPCNPRVGVGVVSNKQRVPERQSVLNPKGGVMLEAVEVYERDMGRWSKLLAPLFVEFVVVGKGDRVLDAGWGSIDSPRGAAGDGNQVILDCRFSILRRSSGQFLESIQKGGCERHKSKRGTELLVGSAQKLLVK